MPDSQDSSDHPSRARLGVLILLCTLTLVLYMDRMCMSQAVEPIKREHGLNNTQISLVMNAFLLAYALFEVPTGRWGDRYGSRRVLARIVVWWSLFTALTGATLGLGSLIAVRFLFGAGEAGAFPNAARVIRRWFPQSERGRVQGLMLASAGIGGALSQVLAGYLIAALGWRGAFVAFGAVGLLWVIVFLWWFYDDPADHPDVNSAELSLLQGAVGEADIDVTHEPIPWAAAARNRNIWLLGAINASTAFCAYLYYSWYPTYMQVGRGVSATEAGWLSGTVLAGSVVGMFSGGLVADWFVRHSTNVRCSRRWFGFTAGLAAAALLIVGVRSHSPWTTAVLTAVSALMMMLPLASWWSATIEISGRHVGSLFGLLNAMGVVGAMASQYFFGALSDWREGQGFTGRAQWEPAIYAYAVVLILGACCWLLVDASKRVEPNDFLPELD
jgi:MFS family permease